MNDFLIYPTLYGNPFQYGSVSPFGSKVHSPFYDGFISIHESGDGIDAVQNEYILRKLSCGLSILRFSSPLE
jgi:hypothetical protein